MNAVMDRIRTYLVQGFLDAGKTTYIQEQIFDGFFHKRGSTLILAFEDGMTEYDTEKLRTYRTDVALYEGGEEITDFCVAAVERYQPDRIYVEMNAMTAELREKLPDFLDVVFSVVLIDGTTLALYFNNMRQLMQNMIVSSHMAIFNRCEDKETLAGYGVPFRLMNPRCDFLRQSAMGYSEKAFGRFLPYDLSVPCLEIGEEDYPVFHLDSHENPENYDGKTVSFDVQVRSGEDLPAGCLWLGRSVMTCCIRDIQFLGFECSAPADMLPTIRACSWLHIQAKVSVSTGVYHMPSIRLELLSVRPVTSPAQSIIGLVDNTRLRA